MTFDQASKAIALPLGKVKPEVKALLPELLKSGRVQEIVAAKRAWYFAPKVVTSDPALAGLKIAILKSVRALEPEVGSFAAVYQLRTAPAINAVLDNAVVELADSGELLLAEYGGPMPVPVSEEHEFVLDLRGCMYIGVAPPHGAGS